MSLINDALKRARVEALRQEAEGASSGYRAVPARSRQSAKPWWQIAGWVVAALAVGLALFLLLRPVTVVDVPAAAGPSPTTPASGSGGGQGEPGASIAPSAEPVDIGTTTAESAPIQNASTSPSSGGAPIEAGSAPVTTTPPVPVSSSPAEPVDRASAPVTTQPPSTSPAREQTSTRLISGSTYLRQVRAADGSKVELGGIAFSEDRPIAVINGAVVSPGDMVAGFTIIDIEANRVVLESDGVRVYLALH